MKSPSRRTAPVLPWICALLLAGCSQEASGPAAPPPPPVVVVAQPLRQSIVEWDRYTGRLEPVEEVAVRARVSGYLQSLHFIGGQLVKRGDLLAVIDPRPFEAEVAGARARLEEARARRKQSDAFMAQAKAQLVQAGSAQRLAASRLANAQDALAANAIAKEQVETRESELAQAVATVEAAEASIASAEADIATSDAAIEVAAASLAQSELSLSYTRITASIDGRTGDRLVTRGNLIEGGSPLSTQITSIVALDPIHVYFNVNEQAFLKYVRLAESGQRRSSRDYKNPIYVALVDEQGYPHRGHIDFVDNRIDPQTGAIRARGILRNPAGLLAAGLFATVRLPGSARYEAILIPDSAILANQNNRFVYALAEDKSVQMRPLQLGPVIDGYRVVRSGLTGDERILIEGLQRVRPGSPVTPELRELELVELEDGLPNDYEPLPEEEWITYDGATVDAPATTPDGTDR